MAQFNDVTEAEFAQREVKSRKASRPAFVAESAAYDARLGGIVIRLTNGVSATFPLSVLPELAKASHEDLSQIVVEGRGYGLHIPALDADISVPQLFEDYLGSTALTRAYKRLAASQANGRLGGRPKKGSANAA